MMQSRQTTWDKGLSEGCLLICSYRVFLNGFLFISKIIKIQFVSRGVAYSRFGDYHKAGPGAGVTESMMN
jgi:hypothetical protein